jgi:hypothetical protein
MAAFLALAVLIPLDDARAQSDVYEQVSEPTLKPGDPLPVPENPVVLTVRGKISAGAEGADVVAFDMASLEKLGIVRFTTLTSWTDEPITFDGVLVSSLLAYVKADPAATKLTLTALNDYQSSAPIEDSGLWPVILAVKENGQYMSIRERGPIWMVYPQHAYPELGQREFLSRWIWQLKEIIVQ